MKEAACNNMTERKICSSKDISFVMIHQADVAHKGGVLQMRFLNTELRVLQVRFLNV